MKFNNEKKVSTIRKKHTLAKFPQKTAMTYDVSLGAIRIVDTTVVANSVASVSPIKLSNSMRANIKKGILAKNVT